MTDTAKLKATAEKAKDNFIPSFMVSTRDVIELIAALEAAEKRVAELENDEVRQRLANAEHQLYMAELAKNNLRASRKAQFKKRKAAEKRIAELEARKVKLPSINPQMFNDDVMFGYRKAQREAVEFYEQVKRENTPAETGAWKDAVNWVLDEACRAAMLQPLSAPYKLPESKEQAEATFRLPDTWMFRWGFENHPANVPVFSADKPTTVVDSKVVSCNPPEGDVQFIHCDLPASWEGKVSAIGCRFNQADPPPHVDIPEEKATDWSEKPIPNGIWFDKVEQSKVKGLTAVRECSKHPGTKLLVHPMLSTASMPPQPIYYCPKCEPKVFEWAELNNPFKPGGGK